MGNLWTHAALAGIADGTVKVLWTFSAAGTFDVPFHAAGGRQQCLRTPPAGDGDWTGDPCVRGWCLECVPRRSALGSGTFLELGLRVGLPGPVPRGSEPAPPWLDFIRRGDHALAPGEGILLTPDVAADPLDGWKPDGVTPPVLYVRPR